MGPHVIISGAGPTGLLLAASLARHRVPFRIVEKDPSPSPLSRAIVVHARTLEILADFGVAEAPGCSRASRASRTARSARWRSWI